MTKASELFLCLLIVSSLCLLGCEPSKKAIAEEISANPDLCDPESENALNCAHTCVREEFHTEELTASAENEDTKDELGDCVCRLAEELQQQIENCIENKC